MQEFSLLFPGQGAQIPGMGRDVADSSKDAMDIWKKAEAASGLPLRGIYWEGDKEAMADTRALQPALTAMNLSLWQALSRNVRPQACAGHSLGEYSALCAAGVLDLDTTLAAVSLRGALMADCDPDRKGAMAAIVKLALEEVETMVAETARETGLTILIANYNTPGQYVVSGDREAVDMVGQKAKAAKGRAIALEVSGAFHSPRMQGACDELAKMLKKAVWRKPSCPVYSNVTGGPLADGESIKDAMLVQMVSPVRWIDIMGSMHRDGMRAYLEAGPKAVLGKMVSKCVPSMDGVSVGLACDQASLESYL
ncbi:MAG: ACP S-malonyltransferase [Desulfovibrio sp.]|nr:ACP S-malonyltransferase [Desulfovibrio sp.]